MRAVATLLPLLGTAVVACGSKVERVDPVDVPLACSAPKANCNVDVSDGCETDVTRDGEHCGACGVSCDFGPCVDGVCGAPAQQVADDQAGVCGMVVDAADQVFWANCRGGRIVREDRDVLADVTGWINDFIIDGDQLYWASRDGIGRVPTDGGPPEQLSAEAARGIAVDAVAIYFGRADPAGVFSMPKGGGAAAVLSDEPATCLAIDAQSVYFADNDRKTLFKIPKAGGSATALAATADLIASIEIVSEVVYWVDQDGAHAVSTSGEAAELILPRTQDLIVVDDAFFYATYDEIAKRSIAGASPTPLAWIGDGYIGGMVVTSTHLYWGSFTNDYVKRVALPAPTP